MSSFISLHLFPSLPLLLLLLSTSPTYATTLCHKKEAAALLKIKQTFGNPTSLDSWKSSGLDCCTWAFVWCDFKTHRVTDLLLMSSDISGPISPFIGDLSSLQNLMIIFANLTGSIPPSIGKLTSLTSLRLYTNGELTGTIPDSLCNLPRLNHLDLSSNSLHGTIPSCLWRNLSVVDLSRNRLTGKIPSSLSYSETLRSINFAQNRLTGDPSFLFDEKWKLEEIDLSGNDIEFDMSRVKFPLRLKALDLNHNRIYGGIPTQIKKLARLTSLNVSYNDLCGTIPTGGIMKRFDRTSFVHNKCLCGKPLGLC